VDGFVECTAGGALFVGADDFEVVDPDPDVAAPEVFESLEPESFDVSVLDPPPGVRLPASGAFRPTNAKATTAMVTADSTPRASFIFETR
jgi:hypothetical protein